MGKLTPSAIAAQAAMQQQAPTTHIRKRSQTVPRPQSPPDTARRQLKPPPLQTATDPSKRSPTPGSNSAPFSQGSSALPTGSVAAAAAGAAFPRNGPLSPGLTTFAAPEEKDHKLKSERSRMKLFSKPKQLTLSKDQDLKDKPIPSPNKMGLSGPSSLSKMINPSVTSLTETVNTSAPSLYSTDNASTSTLIPSTRQANIEKEKSHKPHFLSRQKHRFRDKIDDHALSFTSTNASRIADLPPPPPLYSFAPSSPGPTSTSFAKSVSGFDLRHGGRALREKKKEEKDLRKAELDLANNAGSGASYALLGPASSSAASVYTTNTEVPNPSNLQGFGINNMSADDAWDFLKAKLLIVFEGEELRMPVEDLNRLVSIHIQRCILRRTPNLITEDLRDLVHTGFLSVHQSLQNVPDVRLITHLVDVWITVYGKILPYMQAVFLPLDLEFKGNGSLMTSQEAAEFWGINPESTDPAFSNELDVRRIVLLSYRDEVILPHYEALKSIFSRLSLDSINVVSPSPDLHDHAFRPSTSASTSAAAAMDPSLSSFNSQTSTLLDSASARSRATSNLSAPELPPFVPSVRPSPVTKQQRGGQQVTETVGRMLQCVSVLVSVQSADSDQERMEGLARELKVNWLGRGRTGRQRRGFVGRKGGLGGMGGMGTQGLGVEVGGERRAGGS